jgi:hypothetical protein
MSFNLGASLLTKHFANSLLKLCIKVIRRKSLKQLGFEFFRRRIISASFMSVSAIKP